MTRRGRVMRIRRADTACWSFPVVSAVLRRSPVETRWAGDAAIGSTPLRGGFASGVRGKQPHYVIVHNVGEEDQTKHQPDLTETLFECQPEITAPDHSQ